MSKFEINHLILLYHERKTQKQETVILIGVYKRVWEHKNKVIPGFTAQYNVHMLVYYETHSTYIEAARREKRFKMILQPFSGQ